MSTPAPAPTTTTPTDQAAQLKAEREAQTKPRSKADLAYLNQGTAPAAKITPTVFGDGKDDQPPGGHPADPTTKDSVGSKAAL